MTNPPYSDKSRGAITDAALKALEQIPQARVVLDTLEPAARIPRVVGQHLARLIAEQLSELYQPAPPATPGPTVYRRGFIWEAPSSPVDQPRPLRTVDHPFYGRIFAYKAYGETPDTVRDVETFRETRKRTRRAYLEGEPGLPVIDDLVFIPRRKEPDHGE